MFHSKRFRLIASFLIVPFILGGVLLFVGGYLLFCPMARESTNQVRLSLNAAENIYNTQIKYVKVALEITNKLKIPSCSIDSFVKSQISLAKKKAPNSRRANPE